MCARRLHPRRHCERLGGDRLGGQQRQPARADERRERTDRARAKTVNAGKAYAAASAELREVFTTMFTSPEAATGRAKGLVTDVVDAFASNGDVSILLLSERLSSNNMHTHAINVMLLSLMIAKPLELTAEQMRELGLGALFHDIGMLQIPSAVRMKPEAERSSAEHNLVRTHAEAGVRMIAAGFRLAWKRCATACMPKCSAFVPNTCMWRRAMSAISCAGAATPKG